MTVRLGRHSVSGEAGENDVLDGIEGASGGTGDDILIGTSGPDTLIGGGGDDVIEGRAGNDVLSDGDPSSERADRDRLDGGAGPDIVGFRHRTTGVTVDLRRGRSDGGHGESDRLLSIEGAIGGAGADRLAGDARSNRLEGGPGNDVLEGRAGGDYLRGGTGFNTIRGGAGDDRISTFKDHFEEGVDRASCGPGRDIVLNPSRAFVARDCERVSFFDARTTYRAQPTRVTQGTVGFRVRCTHRAPRCRGSVELSTPTRSPWYRRPPFDQTVGAQTSFTARSGSSVLVRVPLTSVGRRLVQRPGQRPFVVFLDIGMPDHQDGGDDGLWSVFL